MTLGCDLIKTTYFFLLLLSFDPLFQILKEFSKNYKLNSKRVNKWKILDYPYDCTF